VVASVQTRRTVDCCRVARSPVR